MYVGLKVKKNLYDKLIEIMELEGFTISSFVRQAIRNELKSRGVKFEKKTEYVGAKN